jgi:hypothetical protein
MCLWWLPAWSAAAALVAAPSLKPAASAALRSVLRTTAGVSLGLGLTAVMLVPAASQLSATVRASGVDWDFHTRASLPPWHLLGLLVPELFGHPSQGYWPGAGWEWHERLFYVGLVPLALACRASGRWRWACWGAAALAVALAFGRYVPWYAWAQALPGYASFRIPSKHLTLAALALALAAGLGIERAQGGRFRLTLALTSALLGILALSFAWWAPLAPSLLAGAEAAARAARAAGDGSLDPVPIQVAAAVLALLALTTLLPAPWRLRAQLALAAVELILVLSPFYAQPWNPAPTLAALEPLRAYERAAVIGGPSVLAAQMGPVIRVAQPAGYSALISDGYANLAVGGSRPISVRLDRPDSPVLGLLGVQAVFDARYRLIRTVPDPKPAAWVARCAWPGGAHEVRQADFPLKQCVTRAAAREREAVAPPGAAEVLEERAGWLVARAEGPGWLVTRQPWYPGWAAWLDGAPTGIEVLDGALVGVALPAGSHTVTLRYRPAGLELGLAISLAAALVLLATWRLNRS